MSFRHVILTVFVLCGAFSAAAQTLVIYDARDLFPKDAWNPPCKAVFTEDYYYSEEWLNLKDRIDTYLLYQTAKENPDWIPLADEEFRQKIQEGKNMTPEGLRKAICRHAVGGRMFVGAELEYRNRLVSVREKPFTEAEAFDGVTPYANAWGVMNAKGQMIIPFEYQTLAPVGIPIREIIFALSSDTNRFPARPLTENLTWCCSFPVAKGLRTSNWTTPRLKWGRDRTNIGSSCASLAKASPSWTNTVTFSLPSVMMS